MPIYKGVNYVLLALYTEEIENGHFRIKTVKEISEQIIYAITLLHAGIKNRGSRKEGRRFGEEKILGKEIINSLPSLVPTCLLQVSLAFLGRTS